MMSSERRKMLIEKAKEQKEIAQAIAEEKKILAAKPVHFVPNDPRLKKMKKVDAVKIIRSYNEQIAKGAAVMREAVVLPPKVEEPKVEKPKVEKPKKKGRSKKVE